jgi:hypothetical protein
MGGKNPVGKKKYLIERITFVARLEFMDLF